MVEFIVSTKCRLCYENPGLYDFAANDQLANSIKCCTGIKVDDDNMTLLPRLICTECKTTIQLFYEFQQKVKTVQLKLDGILKSAGTNKHNVHTVNVHDKSDVKMQPDGVNSAEFNDSDNNTAVQDLNCAICNEQFGTGDDLKVHKRSHKRQFACARTNCGKVYASAYTLKIHEMRHEGNQRSFLCVTCGKGFMTKNSLNCHEKTHLSVKGYVCKPCNLGFSVRSNLRAHEKIHHEGVRFYCSQCTKIFANKSTLDRHEKIHGGVKDFKCQSCPAAFYTNKELRKHQRYHQGLRLYKCDECFKAFYERHHLVIHLRRHSGEKPYQCKVPECGKSFVDSQKLKRHQNARHL